MSVSMCVSLSLYQCPHVCVLVLISVSQSLCPCPHISVPMCVLTTAGGLMTSSPVLHCTKLTVAPAAYDWSHLSNGQSVVWCTGCCVLCHSDSLGVLPPITAPLHLSLPRTLPLHSIIGWHCQPHVQLGITKIHNFDSSDPLQLGCAYFSQEHLVWLSLSPWWSSNHNFTIINPPLSKSNTPALKAG